ncbi:MAG TPA: LPS assembly lipoprotein LptE [Vicinamibacterales bacterium]|nr:LPS assembly lipoprotein LptE [Vicinamibacterales bacterium]
MRNWSRASGVVAVAIVLAVGLGAAGCGYALAGRGNTLPATIKIIGIPLFVNHSQTPDIDQVLTQAVREEFNSHGRYTVNPEVEGADAVLIATINSVTYVVTAFNQSTHQASRYAVIVSTNVEFKDVKDNNKVLWTNPGLVFRDEYDVNSNAVGADASSFFRQDANALERLSKNFARNIVTSILEAF